MLFCATCVLGYITMSLLGVGLASHSMCVLCAAVLSAVATMRMTYY